MKNAMRLMILVLLLAALAWPSTALARGLLEDKVVFGGTYRLESGETLNGNLIMLGGVATLDEGSNVLGDVVLMGGTLDVSGEVDGNIVGIGGLVDLESTAVVHGDVNLLGAHLQRAQGALVEGSVNPNMTGPLTFNFPGGVQAPRFELQFSPFLDLLWFTFRLFLWAALGVLVTLFVPRLVERTGKAAVRQPVISGGLGLLTALIAPVVILFMAITLILIPVSLITVMVVAVAWGFGLVSLGLEIGKRLEAILKQEWALAVSAGIGTFILILVVNGIGRLVPCVGWTVPAAAGMLGIGAVILTRFGTQDYPPLGTAAPSAPEAPLPPPPPPEPPSEGGEEEVPGDSEVGKRKAVPPEPVDEEPSQPPEDETGAPEESSPADESPSGKDEEEIPPAI